MVVGQENSVPDQKPGAISSDRAARSAQHDPQHRARHQLASRKKTDILKLGALDGPLVEQTLALA
jgi:hypothetical protein